VDSLVTGPQWSPGGCKARGFSACQAHQGEAASAWRVTMRRWPLRDPPHGQRPGTVDCVLSGRCRVPGRDRGPRAWRRVPLDRRVSSRHSGALVDAILADQARAHVAFESSLDDVLGACDDLRAKRVTPLSFLRRGDDRAERVGWMPAAAVYFRDPDGHFLEYLAMLDEPAAARSRHRHLVRPGRLMRAGGRPPRHAFCAERSDQHHGAPASCSAPGWHRAAAHRRSGRDCAPGWSGPHPNGGRGGPRRATSRRPACRAAQSATGAIPVSMWVRPSSP
jgi:hypothetical protein